MSAHNWIEKWQITSPDSGKKYIVSKDDNGEFGCSCPAWTFQRKKCKHIQRVEFVEKGGNKLGAEITKIQDATNGERVHHALGTEQPAEIEALYDGAAEPDPIEEAMESEVKRSTEKVSALDLIKINAIYGRL